MIRARSRKILLSADANSPAAGIFTVQALARIDRVILVDMIDRSRKTDIEAGGWRYDPSTTEVLLAKDPPYGNGIVHIKGSPEKPPRFVLNDF
jgi:hypothetical protein